MTAGTRSSGGTNRALGYATVPGGTALDGPELDAQRAGIEAACRDLGLNLVALVRDHEPNGEGGRPGLAQALKRIDAADASCLIVSDLERLSRKVGELATVVDRLERGRARLIALDVGLDTATPSGRLAIAAPVTEPAEAPPDPEPEPEPVVERAAVTAPPPRLEPPPRAEPPPRPEPPQPPAPAVVSAFGYACVGGEAGASGLDEQKRSIERQAERLGLELVDVVREREPKMGGALDRAGLSYVIERIAAGDATCVVVSALDRISRSVSELGTIVQWFERNDVRLVAVDIGLDTASPGGQATARALASVARWEHERLSQRTRSGLEAARAKRHAGAGSAGPDWTAIRQRIAQMRADGMTLQAIADVLNAERVPTQRGGREWRPSSVQTAAGYKRRSRSKRVEDLPKIDRDPPG
jgi:DNA invertase Pin-like site-specific DNA recombinase